MKLKNLLMKMFSNQKQYLKAFSQEIFLNKKFH